MHAFVCSLRSSQDNILAFTASVIAPNNSKQFPAHTLYRFTTSTPIYDANATLQVHLTLRQYVSAHLWQCAPQLFRASYIFISLYFTPAKAFVLFSASQAPSASHSLPHATYACSIRALSAALRSLETRNCLSAPHALLTCANKLLLSLILLLYLALFLLFSKFLPTNALGMA